MCLQCVHFKTHAHFMYHVQYMLLDSLPSPSFCLFYPFPLSSFSPSPPPPPLLSLSFPFSHPISSPLNLSLCLSSSPLLPISPSSPPLSPPSRRRIDYLLSPVPENMSGRQVPNSSASDVGVVMGNTRGWMGSGHLGNGPLHRSMEMVRQLPYYASVTIKFCFLVTKSLW